MALFVPKDRKSLFRQFLGGMYDAVVITDPNGHILDINPRTTEHFGYELDDVLDRQISTFLPSLTPEIVQRIRKGIENEHHVMITAAGKTRDGVRFACEVAVSVIDLMNPGDLVFTIRNVEKRRQMLTIYRSKENAFEIAQSALFVTDQEGRFTETNAAFREMFDLETENEAKALTFSYLMCDEPLVANFRKALEGETTLTAIVAEGEGDNQEEVEIRLAPNRMGNKIVGVVGSIVKVG